jgi:hypothetical protein
MASSPTACTCDVDVVADVRCFNTPCPNLASWSLPRIVRVSSCPAPHRRPAFCGGVECTELCAECKAAGYRVVADKVRRSWHTGSGYKVLKPTD